MVWNYWRISNGDRNNTNTYLVSLSRQSYLFHDHKRMLTLLRYSARTYQLQFVFQNELNQPFESQYTMNNDI